MEDFYPNDNEYSPSTIRGSKKVGLEPAQDVHFFYTRSHLSAIQSLHQFYQPIFSLFSCLNIAQHNLVIKLCSALKIV